MQKQHVEKFNEYYAEICKRRKELAEIESKLDLQQQDILHFLETERCDAVTMVKATKKLRLIRQERRIVKQELSIVQTISDRMKGSIKEQKFTGGIYKTDVLKEFLN